MKTFGLFIGKTVLLLGVVAILVLMGSTWRVSNEQLGEKLLGFSAISYGGAALASAGIITKDNIPRYPKIVVKERLGALDAVLNGFTLLVTSFTVFPLVILALIFVFFGSIFTGDWGGLIVSALLSLIIIPLLPIFLMVLWGAMFFQASTPGYFVLWLLLGLPAIFSGGAGSFQTIVLIIRIPL